MASGKTTVIRVIPIYSQYFQIRLLGCGGGALVA